MALLRRALLELRARQGDQNPILLEFPAESSGSGTRSYVTAPPSDLPTESLTNNAEKSCSVHFSNPRSTAPA